MSQYIEGELVSGDRLEKVARERRKKREILVVPKPADPTSFPGYVVERELENKIRLSKGIEPWKLFENRVWLLLMRFGFSELNGSGKLFVNARIPSRTEEESSKLEVDVFGLADENVFIIECKTKEELGNRSLRDTITEFGHFRSRVESAVRKHYQGQTRNLKVSFIIATQNIAVGETDQKEAKGCGLFIWTDRDIQYLEDITKLSRLIGDAARYQLYAIMFRNQEIASLDAKEPAILGRIGKSEYYSFLTTPENLLKIAYVHHRASGFDAETLKQIPVTYQRLLQAKKIQEINEFIEERYFPNSIIVSFSKKPQFDQKSREGLETQYGILHLPNRYQSAWIIDGQHRLYGYARSERRFKTKIPVVAFVGLRTGEQAKLFVEINEKQTPVESNLLWDLYSDIYEGSEYPKQIEDLTISNVVKRLNTLGTALKGHIYIPSVSKRSGDVNITMTTICEGIKKNNLVTERMLGSPGLDQRNRESFIAERIGAFFDVLADIYPEDWNKGERGFLRSNNGIAALLIVLRQMIKYFNSRDEDQLYRKRTITDFKGRLTVLLQPLTDYLKVDPKKSDDLRQNRGSAGQSESARLLSDEIKRRFDDFPLPLTKLPALPKELRNAKLEDVDLQIEDTERNLRKFVVEKLRELHGDTWYARGIPGDASQENTIKGTIEKFAHQHTRDYPYDKEIFEKQPEKKLQFAYLGNLKDIICDKSNWSAFEDTFGRQANVTKRFTDFIAVRDAVQGHFHDMDPVVWHTGRGAVIWIRKCLKIWIEETQ